MKHLFPALEARYAANQELTRIGRKLFEATDEIPANHAGNYVVVDGELDDGMGTWTGDIEYWPVRFGLVGKSLRPTDARQWLEQMSQSFKDVNILSPSSAFTTVGVEDFGKKAPKLEGHMFVAGWSCRFILEMTAKTPVVRA